MRRDWTTSNDDNQITKEMDCYKEGEREQKGRILSSSDVAGTLNKRNAEREEPESQKLD